MKTPEGIKRAFEQCMQLNGCNGCSYSGMKCTVELSRDALAYIQQLEEREWELLNLLSSTWYGKQYYFKQEDGTVYSRESCQYLTFDQAIDEFAQSLTVAPKED